MKCIFRCLLLVLLLCCAGCSSWNWKTGKKKNPSVSEEPSKKEKKREKTDTSWIREQFHREQVSEKSMNTRVLDDFEVIPGRKGYRSRSLRDQDPISLW